MSVYERECPKCESIDRFTESELANVHFCQSCYHKYEAIDIHKILEDEK